MEYHKEYHKDLPKLQGAGLLWFGWLQVRRQMFSFAHSVFGTWPFVGHYWPWRRCLGSRYSCGLTAGQQL